MGEVAISARAVTQDLLYKLYHYNHQPSKWDIRPYAPSGAATVTAPSQGVVQVDSEAMEPESLSPLHDWGGGRVRRLLQAIYTTAHLCLLRSDEVLKIQVHDMTFCEDGVFHPPSFPQDASEWRD